MQSLTPIKYILFLLSASFAAAAPQSSLNALPACAQQAGLAAIDATGCNLSDLSCICNSVPFINTLRTYITNNCSPSDQAAALTYGQTTCAPYGVTFAASVVAATTPIIISDAVPVMTTATATTTSAPAPLLAGQTVTSTLSPTAAATTTTKWSDSWSSGWGSSMPTAAMGNESGNATAALMPYTGGAVSLLSTSVLPLGYHEACVLIAGAVGLVAFLV